MLSFNKLVSTIIGAGIFIINSHVMADDLVGLNVIGDIVASPCQISSNSVSQTVDLGQNLHTSKLQLAGSYTEWVNFSINLDSCPAATVKAVMTLHGTPDSAQPGDLYKNSGIASNVAVQLQMQTGEPMGDGQAYAGVIASNAYSYKMRARVYSASGNATAGSVNSVVTATFSYQ